MLASRSITTLLFLLSIHGQTVIGQDLSNRRSGTELPQTVELTNVAKLKIQLDKAEFHSEEVIRVNVGTLIDSSEKIYLPERRRYEVILLDSWGRKVKLETLRLTNPLSREARYLTVKNDYLVDVDTIIIGCTGPYLSTQAEKLERAEDVENPRDLFEMGIFPLAANKCFDANTGSRFSLQLLLFNDAVNEDDHGQKTAVGTIRSNRVHFAVKK